jgi:hypothetical protein
MHLTLKKEATRPPGSNSLQQQGRFDAFLHENAERPHEALAMRCPAELYAASARRYDGLPELTYPFHDRDILVTACGRICLHRKKINISTVLAGQRLGIKEVDDGIWLVSFSHYDLGYFDLEQKLAEGEDLGSNDLLSWSVQKRTWARNRARTPTLKSHEKIDPSLLSGAGLGRTARCQRPPVR